MRGRHWRGLRLRAVRRRTSSSPRRCSGGVGTSEWTSSGKLAGSSPESTGCCTRNQCRSRFRLVQWLANRSRWS